MTASTELRQELEQIATKYSKDVEALPLVPGVDYLPASGKVVGVKEFQNLLQACADMWLTSGHYSDEFEKEFPKTLGLAHSLLVNSGSSANLLAIATLTSHLLGQQRLKAGDEIITAACGFPTTIAPAIQYGLKPVFVDVDPETLNATAEAIEDAITSKTRCVMLAHTLGNPFRADLVKKICQERGLSLIEDCCDALGAQIQGKSVGTFGLLATCSFYPAHHMTMGEGGAIVTHSSLLHKIAMSFRDWGRDCKCPPGKSNVCGHRFSWNLDGLTGGYDHKYIYSNIGYNLKSTDFQAALGLAQLERLPGFIEKRRKNFDYLTRCLKSLGVEKYAFLPKATPETQPSWFGYFIYLQEGLFDNWLGRRNRLLQFLEDHKIGTRLLFGGNLTRQPAFRGVDYRVHGTLEVTDKISENGFWVGIWPGLDSKCLDYIAEKIYEGLKTC